METTEVKAFCKFCTKDIPPAASRCPHCHGDLRSWPARHKVLTGIGVFILLTIILASVGSSEEASTVTPTKSNEEAAIVVSAYELSRAYDENKVAADAQYEGRIVEVSGVIDDIGKDILDAAYVSLDGIATSFFGIQCMFGKSDEPLLVGLSSGQSITLRGRVSGELIGNVLVRGCKIVE